MKFNQGENSNRKLSNRKLSKKELCKQKFEYTSKLEYNFKGFPVATKNQIERNRPRFFEALN